MTTEDRLLRAIEDDLERFASRSDNAPHVVRWRDVDPETAAAEQDRLREWVGWFVGRYCLDHKTVPPCWAQHGALVEELAALCSLWELCYADDAAAADPIMFHRELDAARRRLREWAARRGCSRAEHRDDRPDIR